MKLNIKRVFTDIAAEIFGGFLISVALYNFALEASFPMTGFSGISMIFYRLYRFPIGLSTVILNVPVAVLCYNLLGRGFFLRSIRCMIISSFFVDYIAPLFPVYHGGRMLAAICTGVLGAIGYGTVYMRNSSTGGSDFIVMAVKAKNQHISLGMISFILDAVIILAGGIIFNDIDGIIYAMIINYIMAITVDKMMYGINSGKVALIVTDMGEAVSKVIGSVCGRGTTILNAEGGYKKEKRNVVICACGKKDMYELEKAVKRTDSKSFMIIMDSAEILGEGFKNTRVAQVKSHKKMEA